MDPEPLAPQQPSAANPISIEACCQQLATQLAMANLHFGHGAIDAQSEALWIVSKELGLSPSAALDQMHTELTATQQAHALAITTERISSRKPLAYLLEEAWLMGVPFDCNEQSIVPRSFIAELITSGDLEPWLPADGKVLDLCTGNGSLAILAALACPDIRVTACDISMPALALASRNLKRHGFSEQIELLHGDLFDALPDPNEEERFDLIICNPPYVNDASMQALPAEYQAEPAIALAGGNDGMNLIRRIIDAAPDYLNERGALLIEIGNEAEHFHLAFPQIPVIWMEVSAGNQQVILIQAEDLR
ncbi:MAG: 50S ribosomal protein L3 N(5)-glutamine methyltransferase [Burkholderiales bacterium]|jgi:ribosomal protein L3 glutamine methyltransferase|nr:50S ribosomal protein L3 N(5)-glutamine methyltransferase [Polynucleobacter sp.]MCX7245493.1 50S ribosomal protein L3 N(5)-glutamine methyltransferase [Burkholderiales bacterium]